MVLSLAALGGDAVRETDFLPWHLAGARPGRVARPDGNSALVLTVDGPVRAHPEPRLVREAASPAELPTVGDWVALQPGLDAGAEATVVAVLPRRTAFVRHATGDVTAAHVLAANVDTVFITVAAEPPPNLRRIERFLALAWESGATPVVVLTKSDLAPDVDAVAGAVGRVAPGAPVATVSSTTGEGIAGLAPYLTPSTTVALLGASGAGKSSLVNRLLGVEHLATHAVRSDGKGRHTTTHRELIPLPGGAVVIDTPGLRGLQLWDATEGVERAFADVEALAARCRFRDCAHGAEPGCAVQDAIRAGELDPARLDSLRRLTRELERLAAKQDARLRAERRNEWRVISKALRQKPPKR